MRQVRFDEMRGEAFEAIVGWYVLYLEPGCDAKVVEQIKSMQQAGARVDLVQPKLVHWSRVRRGNRRVREKVEHPAWPRYLIVGVQASSILWLLSRLKGVQEVLSNDGDPMRVPDECIREIKAAIAAGTFDETMEAAKRIERLIGQRVTIQAGPFAGYGGVIERIVGSRAQLKLDTSRMTVQVPLAQFEGM